MTTTEEPVIDATDGDYWTCRAVMVHGVWTTEEYAQDNPWGRAWCNTLNPNDGIEACKRCGFPRPYPLGAQAA